MAAKKMKIGRDAETGRFIPVEEAERRKRTAVVEIINLPNPPRQKKKTRKPK